MTFTARRKIMSGLAIILVFDGVVTFVFYRSTVRFTEAADQILAAPDAGFSARDLLKAMGSQIRQTRWISGVAALFSVLSVAVPFIAIHGDFSKRQRAEEKLRENQERFDLLVDNAREYAIFRLDAAGRVETWNAGAQRIKGYEAREIVGKHISLHGEPQRQSIRGWGLGPRQGGRRRGVLLHPGTGREKSCGIRQSVKSGSSEKGCV